MRCFIVLIKSKLLSLVFNFFNGIYVLLIGLLCDQLSAIQDYEEQDILDKQDNI